MDKFIKTTVERFEFYNKNSSREWAIPEDENLIKELNDRAESVISENRKRNNGIKKGTFVYKGYICKWEVVTKISCDATKFYISSGVSYNEQNKLYAKFKKLLWLD